MIAGGSGMIGRELTLLLSNSGDDVLILSRNPEVVQEMPEGVKLFKWDGKTIGEWAQQLEYCDAVVNLTGENLSGIFSQTMDRRTESVACTKPSRLWQRVNQSN